jgi:hypothetical protein
MGDIGETIKGLYDKFILRDVLSFIIPGAIVILTGFLLFLPQPGFLQRLSALFEYSRDIHWLLYIPLFGFFYTIGFAIQCLGEISGFVLTQGLAMCTLKQRLGFLCPGWHKKPDKLRWWGYIYEIRSKEHLKIKKQKKEVREWASQEIERLVVLKQMCGNNFCAIVLAGIIVGFSYIPIFWLKIVVLCLLIGLPLLMSLLWGHRVHVLRHVDWATEIYHQLENNPK